MLGVKIQGRLGNQLFQYAYAKVLSRKYNTPFFLLNRKDFYADKYFTIKADTPLQNRWKAIVFYVKNGGFPKVIVEDQFAQPNTNINHESDNAIYDGFYQSASYHHSQMQSELKQELTIKPAYQIHIKDFVQNEKPTIVVHVRRTDYVTFGGDHVGGINLTLPLSYYEQALNQLPTATSNVLFLSDDIEFVKDNFHFANALYAEKNSEIVDFQLILQADYLVLANSSFSWWGAYLNTTVQKVIAPKYWLGLKIHKEYPAGIVHPDWITIPS
jgi:hypothetical protein